MRSAQQFAAAPAETALPIEAVGEFVLGVRPGTIQALCGIDAAALRHSLEMRAGEPSRLALFVDLRPAAPETLVDSILVALAQTALLCWPLWYGADFESYRGTTLEREAARLKLANMAAETPAISEAWARKALALAHRGEAPRIRDCPREVELAQLSLAINPAGLVLIARAPARLECADAFVQALEWTARQAGAAIVVLFPERPPELGPFQRILFGIETVAAAPAPAEAAAQPDGPAIWLAPVIGRPHPLSLVEQRLSAALRRDPELAPLFAFNQLVRTVRGTTPRVDLLWKDGKLVVELDGYANHSSRSAFARDRHRDYELTLSGYTVLRLANDEVAEDTGRAVEKVRDLVRLRRATLS